MCHRDGRGLLLLWRSLWDVTAVLLAVVGDSAALLFLAVAVAVRFLGGMVMVYGYLVVRTYCSSNGGNYSKECLHGRFSFHLSIVQNSKFSAKF